MKINKQIKKGIGYLALIGLGYFFLVHGIQAIKGHPGFLFLITGIGIPYSIAKVMLFIVGLVDLSVVIALFTYRKKWVLIYAGLWPIVPNLIGSILVKYIAWKELLIGPALAGIAYWAFFMKEKEPSKR